jgi:O-acetyl-ADP-ribose deacetylase (regulator of RNase III)
VIFLETLVNELIKYFLDEKDHPKIEMPSSYVNKRELLRGLINVRPATYLDEEIIKKEDMLLQSELKEKNIKDVNDFTDRLSIWQGSITEIKVGAIVNFATPKLTGCFKPNHNCIDNNIHSNAGIALRLKCKEISKGNDIEVSKVVLTEGYNLPCEYIIHTVKPNIDDINEEIIEEIKDCIINSLDLAKNNNIDTICIPNLTVKTEDKDIVAKVIMNTIKDYLKDDTFFKKVVLNVLTLDSYNIYSKYI